MATTKRRAKGGVSKSRSVSKLTPGRKSPYQGAPLSVPPNRALKGTGIMPGLDYKHPIYLANQARWAENERRMFGTDAVKDELDPFDWEIERGEDSHYGRRQKKAVYLNFPDIYATAVIGQLLRFAPKPDGGLDFAEMGKISLKRNLRNPTQAEQVFYSTDGPGNIGNEWNNWWMDELRMAMATGHRWLYVESPSEPALNQAREKQGLRPWLAGFSPLDVTNWAFDEYGKLMYAVLRFINWELNIPFVDAVSSVNQYKHYLLLTTPGVQRFGPDYAAGGWWKFDQNKRMYDEGDFADTFQELPLFPLFYERSKGTVEIPSMSRPGTTELGNAAVQFMNISSAAGFQAFDGGKGIEWLAGVDEDGMELATGQLKRGDRYIALAANQDTDLTPHVYPSGSQVHTAQTFTDREKSIIFQAQLLGLGEAIGAPSTGSGGSGAEVAANFNATQVPRIVKIATNLMVAQNIAIPLLAMRYGHPEPTGSALWPTRYDLLELVERLKAFFEIERLAGIRSKLADSKAMTMVAEEKGVINSDDDKQEVLAEYEDSADLRDQVAEMQASELFNPTDKTAVPAPTSAPGGGRAGSLNGPMKTGAGAARDKKRFASGKANKRGPGQNQGGTVGNRKS